MFDQHKEKGDPSKCPFASKSSSSPTKESGKAKVEE